MTPHGSTSAGVWARSAPSLAPLWGLLMCFSTGILLGKALLPGKPCRAWVNLEFLLLRGSGVQMKPRIAWSVPVNTFLVFLLKTFMRAFCSQLCGSQQPLLPSTSEQVGASFLVGRKQKNHSNLIFPLIPYIPYMLSSLFIASDIIPLVRFYA